MEKLYACQKGWIIKYFPKIAPLNFEISNALFIQNDSSFTMLFYDQLSFVWYNICVIAKIGQIGYVLNKQTHEVSTQLWNDKIWDGWGPSHLMFLKPVDRFHIILKTQCFGTGCRIRNTLNLYLYEVMVHQQFIFPNSFTFSILLICALNSQMLYQTAFTTEGNVIPPTRVMEVPDKDNVP